MEKQKNIPQLRFPEFEGEWLLDTLENICCDAMYGINASATTYDGKHKYLRITDIDEDTREFIPNPLTSPAGNIDCQFKLKKGDIVFARTGASVGKSYLYKEEDGDLYFAGFLIKFSIKNANPYFVYTQTLHNTYNKWVTVMSMRSGQPGINAEEYKSYKFKLPTLPEQQKIASFFTAIDEKITQLKQKKILLEQYKKGVMQKIFLQQIRFKDDNGQEYPKWEKIKLGSFLIQKIREVPKPNSPYLAIGVRSHCKGTFQRINSDPDKIEMDKLFVIKKYDLVVNITFAWEGAIALAKEEDEGGLVSHRFPTYIFNEDKVLGIYFQYVFIQKNFRELLDLISPGGAGRNRVLNKKDFLKLTCDIPMVKEQTKIANFLTAIDDKINHTETQIEKAKVWKKGLMEQMFV
jgi:type I restriction enzyme S subunit